MLRYRESLGLLPADRAPRTHRRYDEEALRALTDPRVNADVRRLSELTGPGRTPLAALDFEQQKARRLLGPVKMILPRG